MNDGFCVLPWISVHLDSQGKRRLCCVAETAPPETQKLSYDDFLRSDYLKKIRSEMLSGKLPADCQACSRSHGRKHTYRTEINKRFEQFIPAIAAAELQPWKILSVDYRSPLCNLVCKTCGPEQSTSWTKKIRTNPILRELFDPEKMKVLEATQKNYHYQNEFARILEAEQGIRELFFAGGEPLMVPQHRQWLKSLVDAERAGSIRLIYNTNFTLKREAIQDLIEIWKHFAEVDLLISVDGTEDRLEYIRTGISHAAFEENIKSLGAQVVGTKIYPMFQITTSSILFTQLEAMANFLWEKRWPYQMHFMQIGYVIGMYLRIEFLPSKFRQEKVDQFQSIFAGYCEEKKQFLRPFLMHLQQTIDLPEFSENELRLGILQMDATDQAFGKSFRTFFRDEEIRSIFAERLGPLPIGQPANSL
jgi:hypothetical protein